MLRQLIRDPASVRTWPQQSMPGFSKEVLPEAELDDLLVYLKQMAAQR
jgi:cytochrome c1